MRLRYVLEVPHRAVVPISVLHDVLHDRFHNIERLLAKGLTYDGAGLVVALPDVL